MLNKKHRDEDSGTWMNIYADMVTLLLCFFVLLYSFSELDKAKFQQFLASFQGRSIFDGGSVILPGPETDFPIDPGNSDDDPYWADTQRLYDHVLKYLEDHGLEGSIQVDMEERGVQLRMSEHLFFDPGRADITPQGNKLLKLLLPLFQEIPNRVLVEGHTDTVPIDTAVFPSNWELSAGRSARVVRFFVEDNDLDPKRFIVIGYGEHQPIASNATAAGRALNRRVVLVIRSN